METFDWSFFVLSTLVSTIISTMISTAIAYLANRFLIIRRQEIKNHALAINEGALKEWINKIDNILRQDSLREATEYSHDKKRIAPALLGNLNIIPHYASLESHMESGYFKEWNLWNELKGAVQKYNEERATLLEDIRQEFIIENKNLNLNEFYIKPGTNEPINYVKPDCIAEIILDEIERRLSGYGTKWYGEPINTDHFHGAGDVKIIRVTSYLGDLMHDTEDHKITAIMKFIRFAPESKELIKRAEKLRIIKENIKIKRNEFEEKIKKIVSSIELGNSLKGKCEYCP